MTSAFLMLKNVNLSSELCKGFDGAGLCKNLAALYFVFRNTAKEAAHIVASLGVIRVLWNISVPVTTVFDWSDTDDFNLSPTLLYRADTACNNSTGL